MSDIMKLTCTWGRIPIPIRSDPQVNYLLVDAHSVAPSAQPTPLNFCMVLDRSGSMKGQKLSRMKDATKRVIERLTDQDMISLVIFDDTVQVLVPATPAIDRNALLAQIDMIEECGGTAMSLGLQAGQTELEKHLGNDRVSHLLVLTDGQTWGDEDTCRSIAERLNHLGVRITALGLGSEWNEKLLDDLAELTGGSSDYIADPSKIDAFFQRTIQTAQGTAIKDARLLMRFVRDVSPRAIYRVLPFIAKLGHQSDGDGAVSVNIGDIPYGSSGSVVLDITIPTRAVGTFRIAQAELHFVPIGQQQEEVIKQDVLLDFVAHEKDAIYNPTVMNLVEKVTAFKLQTQALKEAEVGNVAGATQKLRATATRLLDLGELDLAEKAQQQADQLEQGSGLNAESQKALRYATRRLTQKFEE